MTTQNRRPTAEEIDRRVGDRLTGDLTVLAAKQRGYADVQALAREIVESYDWEAAEREVARAIQRFKLPEDLDLEEACQALAEVSISSGSDVAVLPVETSFEELEGLPGICELLSPRDIFNLKQDGNALSVVIPGRIVDNAIEHLALRPEQARRGLGYVHLEFHDTGTRMALAVCVILRLLHQEDIEIVEASKTLTELTLVLPREDLGRAIRLIEGLRSPVT